MEKPYTGRATIHDNLIEMHIIIPARKNWFLIIFLGAWLCGWLIGELFALEAMMSGSGTFFVLAWLVLWTVGGILAFRSFLWKLMGKEIISVGQGELKIERKGVLFFKSRVYDLNEVRNIRAGDSTSFGRSRSSYGTSNHKHTIKFDYGLKTIELESDIDEAEAKFILDKLKERRMITEKNYM